MLVRCHWCQGLFESGQEGLQRCPKCGSELDVQPAAAPPPTPAPGHGSQGQAQAFSASGPGGPGGSGGPGGPRDPWGGSSSDPFRSSGSPGGSPETPPPWERSRELGLVTALIETWKESTLRPTAFFRSLPAKPMGPAFVYGWLMAGAGAGLQFLWLSLAGMADQDFSVALAAPFLFLFGLFSSALGLLLSSFLVHLGCIVFGANKRGYEATFRALAYAQGPQILGVVPFIGAFAANLWTFILTVIALRELQQTTSGRSLAALLLFPILLTILAVVFLIMVFALIGSSLGGGGW